MIKFLVAVAPLALVAACSGGADTDGDGQISAEEAAAEAANVSLTPGQWEMTTQMTDFEFPNMPAEARQMFQEQMGQSRTVTTCITEEEARAPTAEMLAGGEDGECDFSEFSMSGGRMLVDGSCGGSNADQRGNIHMEGSYTPTSMDITMNISGPDGQGGTMRMSGRQQGRRVGECPPDSDDSPATAPPAAGDSGQ